MLSFTTMRTSRRKKERPSRDQVRAWLTTVIAPLASALAVEQQWVTRGNWSFRCHTHDFEFLLPIEKMVALPYSPNLEQLLRYRGDLKRLANAHDSALASLRRSATGAYDRVIQNERFRTLAASSSIAESEHRYLAEYVVNGIRDLASHYVHHEMWTREGAKFLGVRKDPALVSEFRSLEASSGDFAKAVSALRIAVNALQVEFADAYKLPPVDPADAVRV